MNSDSISWKIYKWFRGNSQQQQLRAAKQGKKTTNWDRKVLQLDAYIARSSLAVRAAVVFAVAMTFYIPYEIKKTYFENYGRSEKATGASSLTLVKHWYDRNFDEKKAAKYEIVKNHFTSV